MGRHHRGATRQDRGTAVTAQRADRKARMAAAATRRTEPDAAPAGQTAVRSRPVKLSVNLTPEMHRALGAWTAAAAADLDVPRVTATDAIRAMLRAMTADSGISACVIDLLRGPGQ